MFQSCWDGILKCSFKIQLSLNLHQIKYLLKIQFELLGLAVFSKHSINREILDNFGKKNYQIIRGTHFLDQNDFFHLLWTVMSIYHFKDKLQFLILDTFGHIFQQKSSILLKLYFIFKNLNRRSRLDVDPNICSGSGGPPFFAWKKTFK